MIRPRNFSGDGTVFDWGPYETQGETKCGSGVAAAIASTEPGSGISGLCASAVTVNNASDDIHTSGSRNNEASGDRLRRKFSTHSPTQGFHSWLTSDVDPDTGVCDRVTGCAEVI